jgi:hypothetical protein
MQPSQLPTAVQSGLRSQGHSVMTQSSPCLLHGKFQTWEEIALSMIVVGLSFAISVLHKPDIGNLPCLIGGVYPFWTKKKKKF